jgi:outer membrane protein OmpA-like peptidoglycan-associated protein
MSKVNLIGTAAVLACLASTAQAQILQPSPLLGMGRDQLRGEVEKRYQAALSASLDKAVTSAPDGRYHWALAAKAQCGIAIGFLKHGQVDQTSVSRCDQFSMLMAAPPPPPPAPPPPPPPPMASMEPAPCPVKLPVVFYFGWDEDTPPAEAQPVAAQTVQAMAACHWTGLHVVGHTDLSGSFEYNQGLSERRAHNIATILVAAGAPEGNLVVEGKGKTQPAVPTADGVREPMNRRVEVSPAGQ